MGHALRSGRFAEQRMTSSISNHISSGDGIQTLLSIFTAYAADWITVFPIFAYQKRFSNLKLKHRKVRNRRVYSPKTAFLCGKGWTDGHIRKSVPIYFMQSRP
jgi:hypothetical protein